MAHAQSLVWQEKLYIALGAAVGGFALGVMMPDNLSLPSYKEVSLPIPQLGNPLELINRDVPAVQPVAALQVGGFDKAIAKIEAEKEKRLAFFVPARFQGKILEDAALTGKQKAIALTFDDGPWPDTVPVLDILKKNQVKATFFWVGQHLQQHPDIARKVVSQGHSIGNHTWNHQYQWVDAKTAAEEIQNTAALIYKLTGVKTTLFRPPGGVLNNGLAAYAQKQKMTVAMWSTDAHESWNPTTAQLVESVLEDAKSGSIVLMHDGGGDRSTTVQALPQIIAELKKRGYKFVTLPELLQMQDKQLLAQAQAQAKSAKIAANLAKLPAKPKQYQSAPPRAGN